jgi:transposase-like protein
MPQKSSAKEAYWRKILDQQQECGQSIREFCRQRDLSEASFYFWRKEIRKRPATPDNLTYSVLFLRILGILAGANASC